MHLDKTFFLSHHQEKIITLINPLQFYLCSHLFAGKSNLAILGKTKKTTIFTSDEFNKYDMKTSL